MSFRGGIYPLHQIHHGKPLSSGCAIVHAPAPKLAVIPLSQHIGAPCKPCVAVGDTVCIGQEIGAMTGFVSAPIHASVSGVVKAIEPRLTISGALTPCVVIENDFQDRWHPDIRPRTDTDGLDGKQIIEIVKNSGIVGLGGASFPTHVKLSPAPDMTVDTVILNGAECEPYLTSDHRLMLERTADVVSGLKLIMRALGVDKGVIGVERNKPDAIEALRAYEDAQVRVQPMKVKYPQGSEKQLILAITGREVPSGKLPAAAGCVVCNAGTAVAVYDAVVRAVPLVETVVTVTGAVGKPANVLARVGTPFSDLIAFCGGLLPDVQKVIAGGPMMGIAVYNLDVPVQKSTSGILALTSQQAGDTPSTSCIRCGRCAQGCPMHLLPMMLNRLAKLRDWEQAEAYHALDCIECGSCTYVCPAKLNITTNIRTAKRTILASRRK